MGSQARRWIIGTFILLIALVAAFVVLNLMLPTWFGPPATFDISPSEVTLLPGQGWQFQAVHEGRSVHGIQWAATDGTIGAEGFYIAPPEPGDYQIIAQHPSKPYSAVAMVHVVQDTTITEVPSDLPTLTQTATVPTETPAPPTPTPKQPTSTPTQTPTPTPIPETLFDDSGDLFDFNTLQPFTYTLPGSDIKLACLDEDLRLMRTVPPELASEVGDWNTEENLILWITLYEPVSATLNVETSWLFALDTDNDPATGRPPGSGQINPELGTEVTIGVHSAASDVGFDPYMYVWKAASSDFELAAIDLETRLSTARDTILIRVPVEELTNAIREFAQTEPDWDEAVGRSATLAIVGEVMVADFYPELP
jgi:hypothetical protein